MCDSSINDAGIATIEVIIGKTPSPPFVGASEAAVISP